MSQSGPLHMKPCPRCGHPWSEHDDLRGCSCGCLGLPVTARDRIARLGAALALLIGGMALVLTLESCGGSSTAPTGIKASGAIHLSVVSGDGQTIPAPKDTLPADFVVKLTRNGQPVGDQIVYWAILEDNAGVMFQPTVKTNADGTAHDRVIAGTRASTSPELNGPAHVQVRHIDQSTGEAIVDTTLVYWVNPGIATTALAGIAFPQRASPFDVAGSDGRADLITDQYGNPSLWSLRADSILTVSDSTVLTFKSAGCGPVTALVDDTTVLRGTAVVGGTLEVIYSQPHSKVVFHATPGDSAIDLSFSDAPYQGGTQVRQGCTTGYMADGDTITMAG